MRYTASKFLAPENMKIETTWNAAKGFWEIHLSGEIFYEACLPKLTELLEHVPNPGTERVLINIHDVCFWLSNMDMYYLVRHCFDKQHIPFRKLAVINGSPDTHEKLQFLELCARNRGMDVFSAPDKASAEAWLLAY